MNSTNRLRARVFSALILAFAFVAGGIGVSAQDAPPSYWFAGTRLIFATLEARDGESAVAVTDPGLSRLLARVGATLAYASGQRYVAITTADRRLIAFAVGDARVRVANASIRLPFAPYLEGESVFLPLTAVARALDVLPVPGEGSETILQPQLAALDVRADGGKSYLVARGATALRPTVVEDTPGRLTIAFTGLGSALASTRRIALPGLVSAQVAVSGSARAPITTVTFATSADGSHVVFPVAAPNELELGFAPRGLALDPLPPPRPVLVAAQPPVVPGGATATSGVHVPPAPPIPSGSEAPASASPGAVASPAVVITNVAIAPTEAGATVAVALAGAASFDWHRLSDNRFYIDIHGATLGDAGRDEHPNLPVLESVRVRQIGTPLAPIVRVALSLIGPKRVDVQPNDGGFTLIVGASDALDAARSGYGRIGGPDPNPTAIAAPVDATPPPGFASPVPLASELPWKYGNASPVPAANAPAGANPRLIVLDPGHGGSDTGTAHSGLVEKTICMDIANRLRSLLVAQGWIVKMTRTDDSDVYGPNASDINELQARVNVANFNAARMFISIHVNYFSDPATRGTTTYYTKPQDLALAKAVQRNVIPVANTYDDGVRHGHLYVTNHTTMPAVLVETAFISNPGDVAKMQSPAFLQNMAQGIANGVKEYAGVPRAAVSSTADGSR